jgi:hypothetical protein
MNVVLLLIALLLAGCSVGLTLSNYPESIESCGKKIGSC